MLLRKQEPRNRDKPQLCIELSPVFLVPYGSDEGPDVFAVSFRLFQKVSCQIYRVTTIFSICFKGTVVTK